MPGTWNSNRRSEIDFPFMAEAGPPQYWYGIIFQMCIHFICFVWEVGFCIFLASFLFFCFCAGKRDSFGYKLERKDFWMF